MTEATTARSQRMELRVDLKAGRRSVGRMLGRLVVDDLELAVHSVLTRFIPAQTASKDAVGDISVARRFEIFVPVLHWRQVEVVTFDPKSPLADVSLKLSPSKAIVGVFRARGYSVIDRRA